ncbi:3328_t:CDS:1 [Paraglomus occultum]|uniref:3328_t:CDS:1 n=1 Tax=Paraglomus occultum TaxID=144539 RepID=A0A9N9AMI8_9GLOM|nr:3328_t:CDS:1 [Paraglomus occultum]
MATSATTTTQSTTSTQSIMLSAHPLSTLRRKLPNESLDNKIMIKITSEEESINGSNVVDTNSCKGDKPEEPSQQPQPPQRKRPGRKPNPASPALRKAQNRAAQRAFRERKERHLCDLENTIKALRESQYESSIEYQKEIQRHRSLIESLETELFYHKKLALAFEFALNSMNGNTDATTKIKSSIQMQLPGPALLHGMATMTNSAMYNLAQSNSNSSYSVAHQQIQADTINMLPSPSNSSALLSPISTPPTPPVLGVAEFGTPTHLTLGEGHGGEFEVPDAKTISQTLQAADGFNSVIISKPSYPAASPVDGNTGMIFYNGMFHSNYTAMLEDPQNIYNSSASLQLLQ